MNNRPFSNTDAAIADLVSAHCGPDATAREQHIYREALRGLARLAVMEHNLGLRADMDRAKRTAASCSEVRLEVHAPAGQDLSLA